MEHKEYVDIKKLPSFTGLQKKVFNVVRESSWYDLYGVDWLKIGSGFMMLAVGVLLLRSDYLLVHAVALFIIGCGGATTSQKAAHLGVHKALSDSDFVNKITVHIASEFVGSFSHWVGEDTHVKIHHPHTNIIGLGDSSSWKAPFLSRYMYNFVAPFSFPAMTILVSISILVEKRQFGQLLRFILFSFSGLAFNFYLFTNVSGLSVTRALIYMWLFRGIFAIPYLHVNIFQHIGMEMKMWSQEHRPTTRLYQMSYGVLNLARNPILDVIYGHSLINCHVEHHLFPTLSDNMCLKVKPLVKKYLEENGLPYLERPYMERLGHFLQHYDTLMVNAPPITHFVGIQ